MFLSPLSWVAYVELCVVLLILIVIIIGWQYLKKQKQLLSIIKWGAVFFIVWAWWYIYILKSKLIGNPVMVKIYFVISVLVGLIVVIQLGIKYWEKINRPENLFLIGALFWGVIYMILYRYILHRMKMYILLLVMIIQVGCWEKRGLVKMERY